MQVSEFAQLGESKVEPVEEEYKTVDVKEIFGETGSKKTMDIEAKLEQMKARETELRANLEKRRKEIEEMKMAKITRLRELKNELASKKETIGAF